MKSNDLFLKAGSKSFLLLYLNALKKILKLSIKMKFYPLLKSRIRSVKLRFSSNSSRMFFHRLSAADMSVMKQIFIAEDYNLSRLARFKHIIEAYEAIIANGKTPLIIDAGANIGASVVYFAVLFPQARIVCFEPDPENFTLLQKNTAGLHNIDLRQEAIGSDNGRVSIIDPGEGEWGYRTLATNNGAHVLCAMNEVVKQQIACNASPFIVKIDIEGGEANLFEKNTDWVGLFSLLIIELHDWMLPTQGSSVSFLTCISQLKRDFVHVGENIFSIKN